MRLQTAAPIRGARELLSWIREHYGSIPAFCEAKNIDRIRLQKAIRGGHKRGLDVAFAVAIKDATDGTVLVEWWVEALPETTEVREREVELDAEERERRATGSQG